MSISRSRKQVGSFVRASGPAAQETAKSVAIVTWDTPSETT